MELLPSALLLLPLLRGGSPQEDAGFELRVQRFVQVQEGLCVSVSCSFSFPGSSPGSSPTPHIYWFREGDREYDAPVVTSDRTRPVRGETRGRFLLPGDPRTNNCSLSIRHARRTDTGTYYLRVERGTVKYSYMNKKLNLWVRDVTQKPDIQFGEPLRSGRPTKLACRLPGLCEGHSLSFSWAGEALASMDPRELQSSELTLTPRPQDHGSPLTCRVTLPGPGASTERTVRLDVAYAPLVTIPSRPQGRVTGPPQETPVFKLQVQSFVQVQEGGCVSVPCSFSFPVTPGSSATPHIYWFRDGDREYDAPVATSDRWRPVRAETRDRFILPRDPRTNNCSLSIRHARRADAGAYYLQVETGYNRYSFKKTKLHLDVRALTEKPDIQFGEPLRSGRPAKLACRLLGLCEGHSLSFSWAGEALAPMDPRQLQSSELTLTPRPQDHGSPLTCRVTLPGPGASTERTVRLDVAYAPQTVTASIAHSNGTAFRILQNASSIPVPEGQSLHLVCEAPSNPPASLSWFREGRALSPSGPSAPGVLELRRVGAGDGGELTCLAQHPLGTQHISFSLSVQNVAQRSPSDCSCETEGQRGYWPLVLTLIRGALMGAGFLLTYGLTWIYYTRCGGT